MKVSELIEGKKILSKIANIFGVIPEDEPHKFNIGDTDEYVLFLEAGKNANKAGSGKIKKLVARHHYVLDDGTLLHQQEIVGKIGIVHETQ